MYALGKERLDMGEKWISEDGARGAEREGEVVLWWMVGSYQLLRVMEEE